MWIFFGTVRHFSVFLIFEFFLIFCNRRPPSQNVQDFSKKMFWAFWALDIAPTLDVLVLFLIFQKGPLHLFIFCNKRDVRKIPKGPPFTFFGTMRLTGDFKKSSKENSVNFLSICFSFFRHSATSFRQKTSAKVPPSFFLEFCGRMDLEKYQKVLLSFFFGIVRLFSTEGSAFHFV